MPRTTLNIPAEMLAVIDAQAEEDFSNRSSAVAKLWGQRWSKSTSTCITAHQPASTCNSSTSPDPARAHELQQDRQTDSKSIENGPAKALAAVADAIRDSEWYGATLPKAHTPETYAALLLRLHPQMTPAHVYDASLWLENNPGRRKKYLGGFLTNWMRNDGKFAAATKSQTTLPATSAQRGLGDDEGYENGTW